MSAKPICVIKVDMGILNPGIDISTLVDVFSGRMPDYYVFVIPNEEREEPIALMEFNVFYEKDQIPIDYEGLKEILLKVNQTAQP